jgi:hypothetical protein
VVEVGIVLLAVPFSLIGAVWLLWLLEARKPPFLAPPPPGEPA